MSIVVLQGPGLTENRAATVADKLAGALEARPGYWRVITPEPVSDGRLSELRESAGFDINRLPEGFAAGDVRLLVTDMDSTFIDIECIDEVADFAGLKAAVSAITQASMRGDLRFEESLARRTRLLQGLDEEVLEKVYTERLRLNAGGEAMLAGLRSRGIKTGLVSGGFTFFTERLKQRYGLDYALANVLDIVDGKLSGTIVGDIVGAGGKAAFLEQLIRQLDISPPRTVAVGDGANDLPMMQIAGLSIAFHAKSKVREQADTIISHCGLEGVLGLLDIPVPA